MIHTSHIDHHSSHPNFCIRLALFGLKVYLENRIFIISWNLFNMESFFTFTACSILPINSQRLLLLCPSSLLPHYSPLRNIVKHNVLTEQVNENIIVSLQSDHVYTEHNCLSGVFWERGALRLFYVNLFDVV